MAKQLAKKVAAGDRPVDLTIAPAEQMPFPNQSFDTVVTTHVVCSFDDIPRALREVHRVLRVGGRLVFLEHGLSREPSIQKWQRRLDPVQRLWGDGCRLTVPVPDVLEAAGFRIEHVSEGYLDGQAKTHGYLYEGFALRAS